MSNAFRLGVVLRLRELAEDAARARLASALGRQREAADALVVLVAREQAAQERLAGLQDEGAAAGDMAAVQHGVDHAAAACLEGQKALAATIAVLIESRGLLADATRRREVVERLRDRLRATEALEAQRREDAVLSELAGVRHARSMTVEPER